MNRILYLVIAIAVCLAGSVHASRGNLINDQEGPAQKLLKQAFSKVNMDKLNEKQREAMLKATSMLGHVKEKYDYADEESPSYIAVVSSKMGAVVEYWQQLEVNQKIAVIGPVVGLAIVGGVYFIFGTAQSGDITEILNMTANITQGILS